MAQFIKVPEQNLYISLCSIESVTVTGGPDPDPFVASVRVPSGAYEFGRTTTQDAAEIIAQSVMDRVEQECSCCKKESGC